MAATGIVARKSSLQKNPETFENIMKALIEAEYYVLAPGNKSRVVKTIMTRLKLSDPSLGRGRACGRDQRIRTEALPFP